MSTSSAREFYAALRPLCIQGLRGALNPETNLYDRRLRDGVWTATEGTEDITSTAITLAGLHRAGIAPDSVSLDPKKTLAAMTAMARRRKYPGALGLLLWANAVWDNVPLTDLLHSLGFSPDDLRRLTSAFKTTEIAWLVSGLAHETVRAPTAELKRMLHESLSLLLQRYHEKTGLFYHAAPDAPLVMRMRRRVSNFADQVYPIQALSFAAISENNDRGMATAGKCAERIVALMGELGQWWWHYDARTGLVAKHYPVYGVHQHSMGPMALLALAGAGGKSFGNALALSRAWLTCNELGENLIDPKTPMICRDIEYREGRIAKLGRHLRSVSGILPLSNERTKLKIRYETWPYEWGWCLYVEALTGTKPHGSHLL
ncbi:MAG: hypothetical protein GY862_25740 [Gammaproteobacteria bacterium]|nr:hypothetical protein [Gammaproteobacteria bacterium]